MVTNFEVSKGLAWSSGGYLALAEGNGSVEEEHAPFRTLHPSEMNGRDYLAMKYQAHLIFTSQMGVKEKSRSYRAIIQECIEAMAAKEPQSDAHREILEVMTEGHKVWVFAEALYFTDESKDTSSILLRDWLRIHFSDIDKATEDMLSNPDQNDTLFWENVARLAAVGRRDLAMDVVQTRIQSVDVMALGAAALGDSEDTDDIHVAEAALLDAPEDTVEARADGQFRAWQDECLATSDTLGLDTSDESLGLLLGVLCGRPSAIQKACRTWEEIFVSATLYVRSGGDSLESRTRSAELARALTPSHPALRALADANPPESIALLARPGDYFFAAHLADLFERVGKDGESLRDFFVSEYALSLETRRGTMRLSADYLLSCGGFGEDLFADMLHRVEVHTAADPTVEKLFSLSSRTTSSAAAGNTPGAAYWFAKAEDEPRAVAEAEKALTGAEIGGCQSPAAEILDRTAEAIGVCGNAALQGRLEYVRLYSELQASLVASEEDPRAADDAASLAALLLGANGGLPERHWDASAENATFSMKKEHTLALLQSLETVEATSGVYHKKLMQSLRLRNHSADPELLLGTVRLKLMRNLAVSILTQPQLQEG